MIVKPFQPTIIIPTRDRREILSQLLDSIKQLAAINRILPEIVVADNNSQDDTYEYLLVTLRCFPTKTRILRIRRAGKSAAINDAVKISTGNILAFLDDDVVVDRAWLTSIEEFFQTVCPVCLLHLERQRAEALSQQGPDLSLPGHDRCQA